MLSGKTILFLRQVKWIRLHSSLVAVCLALLCQPALASNIIPVWTYYPSPPFITAEKQGLSYEFIELLNQYAEGQYKFELEFVPRPRINRNLVDQLAGMVLFVNWSWMGDKQKTKYLWSLPILSDRNEVVSRVSGKEPIKINYSGKESLKGLVFGGASGRRYKGLESSFKSGDISRKDVREEEQNLDLLLRNRIDVTSAAATVIRYKVKQKGLSNEVYFSPTPLSAAYTRHFLITKNLNSIETFINGFIQSLQRNEQWQEIKQKYAVN